MPVSTAQDTCVENITVTFCTWRHVSDDWMLALTASSVIGPWQLLCGPDN